MERAHDGSLVVATRRSSKRSAGMASALLLMCGLNVACGETGANDDAVDAGHGVDADVRDHNEVLTELGVEIDLGPATDPDGNPVREDYNPLGTDRHVFQRQAEVYLAGAELAGVGGLQNLLDDATESYATLYTGTNNSWAALPKVSAAGDFDGDGREEIALLILNNNSGAGSYKNLYLRIIEDAAEDYASREIPLVTLSDAAISRFDFAGPDPYQKLDVAVGDIDGDGKDEILATCLSDLWVLDDRQADHAVLYSQSFPRAGTAQQFLRVATGDTDGDGTAEMVVVDGQRVGDAGGTAQYHIYDDLAELETGVVQITVGAITYAMMTADVAVGDIDGDRLAEIVFSGLQVNASPNAVVFIMDDEKTGYSFLTTHHQDYQAANVINGIQGVAIGDVDGDMLNEIVAGGWILDDLKHINPENGYLSELGGLPVHWEAVFAVGDVTGDMKDDILIVPPDANATLQIWGFDSINAFTRVAADMDIVDDAGAVNDLPFPTLATVNTDDDSAILEYETHELLFTEPRIVATLAAPPFYADIPTSRMSTGTSFGQGSSSSVDEAQSLGFSVGYSVGTEVEDRLFTQSSVSFKASVDIAFDWQTGNSKERSCFYYYNGTDESDKVVFTSIPFDVYYYKVLSSPVADEVGTSVVINIPREPQTFFVDRDFYNDNNGSFQDVDETVLGHTIGDPRSYPTQSEVNPEIRSKELTVGQGPGYQTAAISVSETEDHTVSFDLDVTIAAELGAGGIVAGTSVGFGYGYDYTVSSSESTYYAGSVGNILDPDDWSNNQFQFGVYVEPVNLAGQRFPVVGYWVH